MADAQARGWGHPDEPRYRERNIVPVLAGGVRLNVHRTVARLFKGFVDELVSRGYRLDVVADDWGWVNRDIRGRPGVKSNHAWGLAVDLNSTGNPMTEAHASHAGTGGHDHRGVHTDMPPWTGDLARRWGLMWGANYAGTRKDAMHFEFLGRPEDAARYPLGAAGPQPQQEDDMYSTPFDLAPGEEVHLSVEPKRGFFGNTESLLLLDSIHGTRCWVYGQHAGGGVVDVRANVRWVKGFDGGWLHVRNDGPQRACGALLTKRI